MNVPHCVHLQGERTCFSLGNGPIVDLFLSCSGFDAKASFPACGLYIFVLSCVWERPTRVSSEPKEHYGYRDRIENNEWELDL